MSPGSSTESYPAFAHIGLRENPRKNLNHVTCPDRESNPGHLVSRPDALTLTPQVWTTSCMEQETLWNPKHPTYHNKVRKRDVWEAIEKMFSRKIGESNTCKI
ncbi:hypothetical protein ANN_01418 [Periplaneta americana]|uniref:MADF domain-containing protein n=1 Tax=Periplaneta americana TaxID=6978 RepID=A0ABQ8TTH2_PERAM|nr:hypothetical protein ANN_01418 [Periplaneta americana]